MLSNKNLEMVGRKWKERRLRYRFDRVYIRPCESRKMMPYQFLLLGQKKVEGTNFYPSDHWGVRLGLRLSPNDNVASEGTAEQYIAPNTHDLFDDGFHLTIEV